MTDCHNCAVRPPARFSLGVAVLLAIFIYAAHMVAVAAIGGMLRTPDSTVYLSHATHPWQAFGSHHPSGVPWYLYATSYFGLSVQQSYGLLAAARGIAAYALFAPFCPPWIAILSPPLIALWPEFAMLDLSLWSEPPFFLLLTLIAYLLVRPPTITQAGLIYIAFLALTEIRHVAIFVAPALAVALGWRSSLQEGIARRLAKSALWLTAILFGWTTLNLWRSGNPLHPTTSQMECQHFLAAYNSLNYCRALPHLELCMLDPDRKFFGNPSIKPDTLIFDPQGPLMQYTGTPQKMCEQWAAIRSMLIHDKLSATILLITKNFAAQLGPWNASERGAPWPGEVSPEVKIEQFDTLLEQSRDVSRYAAPVALAIALLGIIFGPAFLRPLLLFLVLSSLGHATGIALNNPFLTLRYMAVPKFLLVLAAIPAICSLFRRRQR